MADAGNHDTTVEISSASTAKDDRPAVLIVGGLGTFLVSEHLTSLLYTSNS